MRRPFALLACLLAACLAAGPAFASPPWPSRAKSAASVEAAAEAPPVRTGTSVPVSPPGELDTRKEAPSDAPRTTHGELQLPPVPAGFNSYDGGWIRFIYHPSIRERVQPLIANASAVRTELMERLGQPVLSEVRVAIARTPGEMSTLAPANAPYPDYAAGVAYPEIGLVLLTVAPVHPSSMQDLSEVFRHELAHVALEDAIGGRPIPRWFNEGFAVLASGETSLVRLQTLLTATVSGNLLTLSQMDRGFPAEESQASIAYAQAVDVVRFLVRREDRHRFRGLIGNLRDGQTLDAALLNSYGIETATLETDWREDVAKRYTFWPVMFSGSFIWAGVLGLFVWGWRKRKQRAKLTLSRWAREEAAEDVRRREIAAQGGGRVHIVLARTDAAAPVVPLLPPMIPPPREIEVPKVEHDGQWHTLH